MIQSRIRTKTIFLVNFGSLLEGQQEESNWINDLNFIVSIIWSNPNGGKFESLFVPRKIMPVDEDES